MGANLIMPKTLIHKPTNTLFISVKKSVKSGLYATESMAKFPIAECEQWQENYPPLATAMPPEIGEVVIHHEHVFVVVRRTRCRETQRARLWHSDTEWYWMDDCKLVTEDTLDGWTKALSLNRYLHKEDTEEYRSFIEHVPLPIRDRCIVRSFDRVLRDLPMEPNPPEFF